MNFFTILFALLIGHAVADYPLQGDFLSRGKNLRTAFTAMHWAWLMAMHCLIHAGAVWLITGLWYLGLLEFGVHFVLDWMKCDGVTNFNEDQISHLACKVLWSAAWVAAR